jgi:hypothetical protein
MNLPQLYYPAGKITVAIGEDVFLKESHNQHGISIVMFPAFIENEGNENRKI